MSTLKLYSMLAYDWGYLYAFINWNDIRIVNINDKTICTAVTLWEYYNFFLKNICLKHNQRLAANEYSLIIGVYKLKYFWSNNSSSTIRLILKIYIKF